MLHHASANTKRVNSADDERSLFAAAAAGDFVAFEAIVKRYRDRVYRLAMGMMKNPSEAEEVVQDAFLNIYKSLQGFRGDSAPATWIYRLATNAALMRMRQRQRKPLLSLEDQDPGAPVKESIWGQWPTTPVGHALNTELRHQIESAIARLPEQHRIVLLLRDVEGFNNAEVAQSVGLTIPTVKARLHRARLFVRGELNRYFQNK